MSFLLFCRHCRIVGAANGNALSVRFPLSLRSGVFIGKSFALTDGQLRFRALRIAFRNRRQGRCKPCIFQVRRGRPSCRLRFTLKPPFEGKAPDAAESSGRQEWEDCVSSVKNGRKKRRPHGVRRLKRLWQKTRTILKTLFRQDEKASGFSAEGSEGRFPEKERKRSLSPDNFRKNRNPVTGRILRPFSLRWKKKRPRKPAGGKTVFSKNASQPCKGWRQNKAVQRRTASGRIARKAGFSPGFLLSFPAVCSCPAFLPFFVPAGPENT